MINLHEVYESQNSVYLILDFLQGNDLICRHTGKNSFSMTQVKQLFKSLLTILLDLKECKLIHRSILPHHLILQNSGSFHPEYNPYKLIDQHHYFNL